MSERPTILGLDPDDWTHTPPTSENPDCPGPSERCQSKKWCDHVWCATCQTWNNDTGSGPNCGHGKRAMAEAAAVRFIEENQLEPYDYVKLLRAGGPPMSGNERHEAYERALAEIGPVRPCPRFSESIGEETGILWLPDRHPDLYDYVRQVDVYQASKVGRISDDTVPGTILGWTTVRRDLDKKAYPHLHRRRIFWVKPTDRGGPQDDRRYWTTAPERAADPRTLAPREPGLLTERAWGSKFWDLRIEQARSYPELVAVHAEAVAAGQWTDELTALARKRTAVVGRGRS